RKGILGIEEPHVSPFVREIEFPEDRRFQHPKNRRQIIRLQRVDALMELTGEPLQYFEIRLNRLLDVRTLNFYRDLFARFQPGKMDMRERGSGDRLFVKLGEDLLDLAAEFLARDRTHRFERMRPNRVLEFAKLKDK